VVKKGVEVVEVVCSQKKRHVKTNTIPFLFNPTVRVQVGRVFGCVVYRPECKV